MAMSGGKDDGSPMMEMNTTPLIDVMLCLLIIFIMSIPVATNAVNIDLPQAAPPTDQVVQVDKNKLVLTNDGKILWNGVDTSEGQLISLLQATKALPVEPELQFQPEQYASYETTNRLMKDITTIGLSKFGFVGNENYRVFGKAPGK